MHAGGEEEQVLELREEELVAQKELRELGAVTIRKQVEEVPGRLELDAYSEEVQIEHEPVGRVVTERQQPWEEDGTMMVPVYEEQLVVTKRLILKEVLRITRARTSERRLFEETLRRERLVIEDPEHTGLVREHYPADDEDDGQTERGAHGRSGEQSEGGLLEELARKVLE